jgi:hypothetical protein
MTDPGTLWRRKRCGILVVRCDPGLSVKVVSIKGLIWTPLKSRIIELNAAAVALADSAAGPGDDARSARTPGNRYQHGLPAMRRNRTPSR